MKPVHLVILVALAGCGKGSPPTEPSAQATRTTLPDERPPAAPEPAAPAAPAGVPALQELLQAHHGEDLPDADVLAAHDGARESLLWLGAHGDTMSLRTRALMLLAHYDDEEVGVFLHDLASDASNHAALRGAALTGLSGQDLAAHDDWQRTAMAALEDADLRVVVGAVKALYDEPFAAEALAALAADEGAPTPVREAAAAGR
ncbi:MAG: hypothetical protein H6737_17820 [Alphaproteobacteria bacterium]|nr:hypothetical protein [Alphaproteobacteria bacterium]